MTLNRPTTPSSRPVQPVRNIQYRDYDDWIDYDIEYEHQHSESSTTGMIRGAIQAANDDDDFTHSQYYDDSDNYYK